MMERWQAGGVLRKVNSAYQVARGRPRRPSTAGGLTINGPAGGVDRQGRWDL